jgi:protein-tyrosine phosphatase
MQSNWILGKNLIHLAPWRSPTRSVNTVVQRSPFSWILSQKLAIGRLPKAKDCAALLEAKINVVLSLSAPSEGELPVEITQNFNCLRLILPDSRFLLSLQVDQLAQAVKLIHQTLQNGQSIYVHCLAGVERSPIVCVAYLCRYHNLDLWQALNRVKQVNPRTMPTHAQLQIVREFLESY